MIDLGISKLALIGAVALIVIWPEKLPRVARTVGTLIWKAQKYVSDVKAEVNRSMELEELKKMKDNVESAAQSVKQSFHQSTHQFEKDWQEATAGLDGSSESHDPAHASSSSEFLPPLFMPQYRHPGKNWRLKRSVIPQWYKARQGVRTKALSGAARVARFRPRA